MSSGLDKAQAKLLRDRAVPTYDSKSFCLKCPSVDESMLIAFKQFKNAAAEAAEKHYLSFQYKILDIAKPLLTLRGACESEAVTIETLRELIDLSLDLWALAFNHATHSRRRNILKVIEAELMLLLNNADHFSEDQTSYLVGEKFVTAMRNQASHITTLRNVKRVVNQSTRGNSHPQRFHRRDDRGIPSNRGHQPQRYANVQVWPKATIPVTWPKATIPVTWPKATIPVNCIGGRLKYSAEQWHLVTNDPWVLQTVRNGLIIAFSSPPFQRSMPRSAPMGECQSKICNDEVDSLLKKGATVVVQDNSDGFYSSLFFFCDTKEIWRI